MNPVIIFAYFFKFYRILYFWLSVFKIFVTVNRRKTNRHKSRDIYIYIYILESQLQLVLGVKRKFRHKSTPCSESLQTSKLQMISIKRSNLNEIYFLVFQLSLLVTLTIQNVDPLKHVHDVTSSKYSGTKLVLPDECHL